MVEYSVILKRHEGSTRPNVCVYMDEDKETAIKEMQRYCKVNGFAVEERGGRFSVADILLVGKEPIAGAPVLSVTKYTEIFDVNGKRRKEKD